MLLIFTVAKLATVNTNNRALFCQTLYKRKYCSKHLCHSTNLTIVVNIIYMYMCMVVFLCVEINKFVIFDHIFLLENNLASVLEQISLKIHGKPSTLLSMLC